MAGGDEQRTTVEVDGRRLSLSNLDKVLYPETGFTKGEVIDYYARIAPVVLPHLEARPMSFKRYPDGVESQGFFAKNAPPGTPDWVRTVRLPVPGSSREPAFVTTASGTSMSSPETSTVFTVMSPVPASPGCVVASEM